MGGIISRSMITFILGCYVIKSIIEFVELGGLNQQKALFIFCLVLLTLGVSGLSMYKKKQIKRLEIKIENIQMEIDKEYKSTSSPANK